MKRTEWKTAPKGHRSLAYRQRKINDEEDHNEEVFLAEQGLSREFPERFMPGNFWYDHIATTEQQASVEDQITLKCAHFADCIGGAIETYVSNRQFTERPDDFLN